jgi:hypothetical protein
MDIIDLVRKSSGGIIGAVRLEKDLAADLSAFKEAVRFDLKADLRFVVTTVLISCFFSSISSGRWKTLKSNVSMSSSTLDNGSSNVALSPGGDDSGCIRRVGSDFFPRDPGVRSEV